MSKDICGAKTRAGSKCNTRPMLNGRCRMHGGTNKGNAAIGNTLAVKHGIYSKRMTPEEIEQANTFTLGDLDDELRLTKIRLIRVLEAENQQNNQLELESSVERQGGGAMVAASERTFKVRDYTGLADRLTARIQSIERDRAFLIESKLDSVIKQNAVKSLEEKGNDEPINSITVRIIDGAGDKPPFSRR